MENTNIPNQPIENPTIQNSITPQKNIYKTLFFILFCLFLISITSFITILITGKSKNSLPVNIEKTTEPIQKEQEPIIIPTTSANKTKFQQMIISFNLYKELTSTEKQQKFTNPEMGYNFWPATIVSSNNLYLFAQKLIKGSIKKLTINKNSLNTILGDYNYNFYLTPNYENWSNEKFLSKETIPESIYTGIGDLTPIYAYSDKLIWSDSTNCGGAKADNSNNQKAQDQCNLLVREIETAF